MMTPGGYGERYVPTPATTVQKQPGSGTSPKFISVENTYSGLIRPISGNDAAYANDTGIDISAKYETPIYAAGSGTISYSYYKEDDVWSPNNGYPNDTPYRVFIVLKEPVVFNGIEYNGLFYGHLSSIEFEKERGENKTIKVEQGQLIGHSGIGNNSAHLHLAIYPTIGSNPLTPSELQVLFRSSNGTVWTAGQ